MLLFFVSFVVLLVVFLLLLVGFRPAFWVASRFSVIPPSLAHRARGGGMTESQPPILGGVEWLIVARNCLSFGVCVRVHACLGSVLRCRPPCRSASLVGHMVRSSSILQIQQRNNNNEARHANCQLVPRLCMCWCMIW